MTDKQAWLELWKLSGEEGEKQWKLKQEMDARGGFTSHQVMPDIQGYQSQATGEWIGSRSAHRKHLKEHRLIEIGNEKVPDSRPQYDPGNLKQELARHFYR
jgi:hypothetical protein